MKRLRIHPSVLAFWYSSDELPPEHVEQAYLDVFKTQLWPNPVLASASNLTSNITGPTGVKVCARWGTSVMNPELLTLWWYFGCLQMSGPYGIACGFVACSVAFSH